MSAPWIFALQTAAASTAPLSVDYDLATARRSQWGVTRTLPCASADSSEIVVCGRRRGGSRYRIEEMERMYEEKPPVAETSLGGGGTGGVFVDQVQMPNGEVSKRVMVGIKLSF